jgi:ATP-binding cassette subfamily F protein uup
LAREAAEKQSATVNKVSTKPKRERDATKMTYNERREFEALTNEIEKLTAEKKELDALFATGENIDDITTRAARYQELQELLDEKEMRWLDLSEKS